MIFKKRIAGKFAGKFAAKRTSGKVKGTLIVRVRCLDSDDERKEKKNAKGLYIIPFRRIEMMEDATVKQLECRLLELDLGYAPPPKNISSLTTDLFLVWSVVTHLRPLPMITHAQRHWRSWACTNAYFVLVIVMH